MLSKSQEKLIRSLLTRKGREESGLCLVEGKKPIQMAGNSVIFSFTKKDTKNFDKLVTTETPQEIAAVAKAPVIIKEKVLTKQNIIVLDGVQDPANVGAIMRLCLGFNASLILIESAEPTNPKVIRGSAGAIFQTPYMFLPRARANSFINDLNRPIFRLESKNKKDEINISSQTAKNLPESLILIVGSEGSGIKLDIKGRSVAIKHNTRLESLNVSHAVAIFLAFRYLE
ncbi:MAG: hypothetical protein ACD_76C00021G0002 [uncultured bacterium]|nr:MAG: hypothetical protein ACD_76C00021G0002 [uncultured bacterium]HBD05053.1 hypothetical protein [Candidatus Uhrbacteria bacterium]